MSKDSMNYFFDKEYAQLEDSMTEREFTTRLCYVISKIGCGHTSIRHSKAFGKYLDTARLPQFPLILKFWKDTMVVAANLNRNDSILKRGVLLKSINGFTAAQLEDTLFQYIITDGVNLTGKYQYLSTGFNFSSWYKNVLGLPNRFTIDYFDSNNALKEVVVPRYDPRTDTVRRFFPPGLACRP